MAQRSLFATPGGRRRIDLPDAEIWLDDGFLSPDEASRLMVSRPAFLARFDPGLDHRWPARDERFGRVPRCRVIRAWDTVVHGVPTGTKTA